MVLLMQDYGEMVLISLRPGCTIEEVQKNLGWNVRVAPELKTTDEPNERELQIIREKLYPNYLYI